jgi:predicted ATPase
MHIVNIRLQNWKNFASVDVNCGMRVFLIGPNAAGKSNFLDSLRFLKDIAQHGLRKAVIDMRGGLKSIRCINARARPEIAVSITLDSGWRYSLSFGGKSAYAPVVVSEKAVFGKRIILNRPDGDDTSDPLRLGQTALEQVYANKNFREVATFLGTMEYRHILPHLVREPRSFSPGPIDDDPFGRDLVCAIWKTPEKTRKARLGRINSILRAAVPNFRDLQVVQDPEDGTPHFQVNYGHWRKNGVYQDESAFSDGTLRFLALLWSLLDSGGPLLLEEPELSLHEGIVSRLPGFFAQIDKEKKKAVRQLFVTTHADALLRDPGVGPREVLRLVPGENGVDVVGTSDEDCRAMKEGGLTAADILLPKTRPANIERMEIGR